jgi:hypothetical protein
MPRRITEDHLGEIRRLARQGVCVGEIAAATGFTDKAIYKACQRMEAHWSPAPCYWTAREIDLLERYIGDGFTLRSTASLLGRPARGVSAKANSIGLYFAAERKDADERPESKRTLSVTIKVSVFRALQSCASELEMEPSELTRVILNIVNRRFMWAEILGLNESGETG